MATRAKIGLMLDDYTVKSVYHHWDGYPEWLGAILMEKYTTKEDINRLLDGGDLSSISSKQDWQGNYFEEAKPLYYKDRGETGCDYKIESPQQFSECTRGEEYIYLFMNGKWSCFTEDKQPVGMRKIYV